MTKGEPGEATTSLFPWFMDEVMFAELSMQDVDDDGWNMHMHAAGRN